jgi:hypothetical protein
LAAEGCELVRYRAHALANRQQLAKRFSFLVRAMSESMGLVI